MELQLNYPAKNGGVATDKVTGFGSLVVGFQNTDIRQLHFLFESTKINEREYCLTIINPFQDFQPLLFKEKYDLLEIEEKNFITVCSDLNSLLKLASEFSAEQFIFYRKEFREVVLKALSYKAPHLIISEIIKEVGVMFFYEEKSLQLYFRDEFLVAVLKVLDSANFHSCVEKEDLLLQKG